MLRQVTTIFRNVLPSTGLQQTFGAEDALAMRVNVFMAISPGALTGSDEPALVYTALHDELYTIQEEIYREPISSLLSDAEYGENPELAGLGLEPAYWKNISIGLQFPNTAWSHRIELDLGAFNAQSALQLQLVTLQ